MLGGVEVAARMAILRRVAAAHVTAFQAHAQMDPRVSQLQAFFATFGVRLDFLEVVFDVNARCRHENPPWSIVGCRYSDLRCDSGNVARC
jgi:hypothetical protein